MPKDFAQKKAPGKKRGASRQSKKQSAPITLWLFTILLVGSFASGLIYLKWFKQEQPKITAQVKPEKTETIPNSKVIKTPILQDDDIPLYKLHQELINKEVIISKEDLKLPDNLQKYYYTMPCGAFRESYRAEELKAQIAMTGNNSSVTAVHSKGEIWHRVQLGPFSRKRAAESVRHRLRDNDIQGCLINRHLKK